MEKLENVEFHDGGVKVPESSGDGFQFVVAKSIRSISVRTRSKEDWPRECYRDRDKSKDNIHFISYEASSDSYLLETAVRIGRGYQRQEAKMTVDDIKARNDGSNPDSTSHIVEIMSGDLAYSKEGFAPHPELPALERSNAPLEPDDPLSKGRGARGLSEEKRALLRTMLAQDPVEKNDLPEGVLTLTSP